MYKYPLFDIDTPCEAINFIRGSVKDETAFVDFSGDKDSIVTAELLRESGVKFQLYYSFTGLDAPQVIRIYKKATS